MAATRMVMSPSPAVDEPRILTSAGAQREARVCTGRYADVAWSPRSCGASGQGSIMMTKPRITSFAPQLLVDDLDRAINFYRDVLGFSFGPTWGGFYAIGERDGFQVHLKCAPKTVEDRANRRQHTHLDVYASVAG